MGTLAGSKMQKLSNREEKHTYSEIQQKTPATSLAGVYIWTGYLDLCESWWTEAFVRDKLHALHGSAVCEAHPYDYLRHRLLWNLSQKNTLTVQSQWGTKLPVIEASGPPSVLCARLWLKHAVWPLHRWKRRFNSAQQMYLPDLRLVHRIRLWQWALMGVHSVIIIQC